MYQQLHVVPKRLEPAVEAAAHAGDDGPQVDRQRHDGEVVRLEVRRAEVGGAGAVADDAELAGGRGGGGKEAVRGRGWRLEVGG